MAPRMRRRQHGRRNARVNTRALPRAMRFLGNHRRSTFLAYFALIIASMAQLAVPQLTQNMINAITDGAFAKEVLDSAPPEAHESIARAAGTTVEALQRARDHAGEWLRDAALIIVLFAFVRGAFSFIQTYMAENTSQGVAYDFRNAIYRKVQRLSFSYYDRTHTGQIMIRATDDVERLRIFLAQGLVLTAQSFLLLLATLIILFLTNWQLTLVILPILPVALVLFGAFGAFVRPLFSELQRRLASLNTILQENLAGIRTIKGFRREKEQQARFQHSADDLYTHQIRLATVFSTMFPLIFLVSQIGQGIILYFSGQQIFRGALTLGGYQSFSLYLLYVFFPLGQLGFIISLVAQASASAERIFEVLDTESEVRNRADARALPSVQGHVSLDHVTFSYFREGQPVLQEVSLEARPGETVALLGATGSGKTSIINLLPRFYDVTEGAVLIDGHDVREVTLESLRAQIGIVLQETNLFSGSIRENIAFGRPEASLEEIIAAAEVAEAHEFITSFPAGYDTPVGERGATLSGGQKQRIAIARAILLNPRILIMDDSTSSVDLLTEQRIQKALDQLVEGRTSFIIAQRISTVLHADQIIVLERGRIVASGVHADLLEASPEYAEIFASQLVEDILPAKGA